MANGSSVPDSSSGVSDQQSVEAQVLSWHLCTFKKQDTYIVTKFTLSDLSDWN